MKKVIIPVLLLILAALTGQVLGQNLRNASHKFSKPAAIFGVRSNITFREPIPMQDLNASYHRVIIYRSPIPNDTVERFVEFGWAKGFVTPFDPYINQFGFLLAYGIADQPLTNEFDVFLHSPGVYGYVIEYHNNEYNPDCSGGNFHTIGFYTSTGQGYLLRNLCKSLSQVGKGDKVAWGGEARKDSSWPDLVGNYGSGRVTNMYWQVQWNKQKSDGTRIWKDIVNFLPHRNECPYSIHNVLNTNGIYYFDVCGVEDGVKSPAIFASGNNTCTISLHFPCP